TAQFTVAAAGSGLEYQWQHNGGDIAGADTDTLQISNVQSSDTGNYRSVVSNNGGQVTSDQVSLTLTVTGDFDIDDDVDQEDFGHLQQCMTGKGVAQNDPHCLDARMDQDQDVDPTDFNIFNNCLAGPNIPPDPACDD
ncbi:MAG: immunoglobulin domain-containing family protein, partial [Planctomycetota bacterium]